MQKIVGIALACALIAGATVSPAAWAEVSAQEATHLADLAASGDTTALKNLLASAKKGNKHAQAALGWLYTTNNEAFQRDYDKAYLWAQKSAHQSEPSGQYLLGMLYDMGGGVKANDTIAVQWLQKASAQGNAGAQALLGSLYERGTGVAQDYEKAAKLYLQAAQQGNASAQGSLGDLYERGQGVPQDMVKAAQWYRQAAQRNNGYAKHRLGVMYAKGIGLPQNIVVGFAILEIFDSHNERVNLVREMSPEQIEEAVDLSRKIRSENLLAVIDQYLIGKRPEQTPQAVQTAQHYHRQALKNVDSAQENLALLHEIGLGVPHDWAQAIIWYRKAALVGNRDAQFNLGWLYAHGQGVPLDYTLAVMWLRKAALQNQESALYSLAMLYASGHGVPKNSVAAAALLNRWVNGNFNNPRFRFLNELGPKQVSQALALGREMNLPANPIRVLDHFLSSAAGSGHRVLP